MHQVLVSCSLRDMLLMLSLQRAELLFEARGLRLSVLHGSSLRRNLTLQSGHAVLQRSMSHLVLLHDALKLSSLRSDVGDMRFEFSDPLALCVFDCGSSMDITVLGRRPPSAR